MKFNYSLKPLNELMCELKEKNQISWFYLTDGSYNIEFEKIKLFEYSDNAVKEYNMNSNDLDYYVIRIIEDIFDMLINTINPMPEDLFLLVDSLEKRDKIELQIEEVLKNVGEEEFEKCLKIFKLVCPGCIDTTYLNPGFENYFFHVNDSLYIYYNCENDDNIWTAKKGIIKINYDDFVNEFKIFVSNFMNDMKNRINEIINLLDENLLEFKKEHEARVNSFEDMLKKIDNCYNIEYDEWDNLMKLMKKYKIILSEV